MELTDYIFEGILSLGVGLIGLIGNAALIVYFGRRKYQLRTFQRLLQWLSVFDSMFILSVIFVFAFPKFYNDYDYTRFPKGSMFCIQPYILPLAEIGLTGSIYFTIAISVERYLVICRPFLHLTHSVSSKAYIIPIVCFSIIFNIPHFFEWEIVQNYSESTKNIPQNSSFSNSSFTQFGQEKLFHTEPTNFRKNESYYQIYWVGLTICFRGIIPYFALIILNIMVAKALIRNRHDQMQQTKNSFMMRIKTKLSPTISDEGHAALTNVNSNGFDNDFRITQSAQESRRRKLQIDFAKVSLAIVGVFVLCHSVKWIPNIYELLVITRFEPYFLTLYC